MNIALNKYGRLALWIATYLLIGWAIGRVTIDDVQGWYAPLLKPPLNPPNLVFPIVWTSLYVMIAIAGWRLSSHRTTADERLCFNLFIAQTAMNWAWSFIFFEWHLLGLAFIWIVGMIIVVATLIYKLWSSDRITALLLIPYLLWISFASYLSGSIWFLN